MSQITAQVPDTPLQVLDTAAADLERSRAEIVHHALERNLEDFEDINVTRERLRDPTDKDGSNGTPVLPHSGCAQHQAVERKEH